MKNVFFVLIAVLAFSLISQQETWAADNVPYLDRNGTAKVCPSATDYDGGFYLGQVGTTTWHLVTGDWSPSKRITVRGDTHLILADDAHLNANLGGLQVEGTNSLTIYAQSTSADRIGRLTADSGHAGTAHAGIGGNGLETGGTIIICGGAITATCEGEEGYGAGIGGGFAGKGGIVTIFGGIVTATSEYGAGIGGGDSAGYGDTSGGVVSIRGGTVTATSKLGSDIGGGYGTLFSDTGDILRMDGGNMAFTFSVDKWSMSTPIVSDNALKYGVTLLNGENGTLDTETTAGTEVTLKVVSLKSGYTFTHWDISPENVAWTNGDAATPKATFIMPETQVTVTPVYQYDESEEDRSSGGGGCITGVGLIGTLACAFSLRLTRKRGR